MLSLLVRGLLICAAAIASWIVARDAPNFSTVQMVIAVLLFVLLVFAIAFWPAGLFGRAGAWIKRKTG